MKILWTSLWYVLFATLIYGQPNSESFTDKAVQAVEQMILSAGDGPVEAFVRTYMHPAADGVDKDLLSHVRKIREIMHDLNEDVGVGIDDQGIILMMAGGDNEQRLRIVVNESKKTIEKLVLLESPVKMNITVDNLAETIDRLEDEGMAGVIYLKKSGEVLIERGFGMANAAMKIPNNPETIFGTGSRPIDYTIAAVLLLDQQGKLALDDPIARFVSDVPEDKKAITLRHLMTGQSGLPDFFDMPSDWDPDLHWVDRETAVRRMMSQTLHFEPGTKRKHSHGAFGLLAAIIEYVSDTGYYDFIRENFLDPAGMTRTGEYGESRGLSVEDFAVGYGYKSVGLPNIPPNWGPTSWLIKGSGGMYSTLGDLLRFYDYVRSGNVLDEQHSQRFRRATANLDGSERGFELFSVYENPGTEVYLFLNNMVDQNKMRQVIRGLERLVTRQ